jgi:hypothetical protein
MNTNLNSQEEIDSKYECPICQYILTDPHELSTCHHVFCKACIESTIEYQKSTKYQCPMCKIEFSKKSIQKEASLESEIKLAKSKCSCGEELILSEWNNHINNCDEYNGVINSNIKQSVVKDVKPTVNRSTFTCPGCDVKNLDREALIKHVNKYHKELQAVCPICVCQPWGDSNYITVLLPHLKKRHKFDYDTNVDYNDDEDEVLKRVLMESMYSK